jgi:serine/threonine-protein kinase SRPK3
MNECFHVTPIHKKYFTEEYKEKNKKERDHISIVLPLMAGSTYDLLQCNEYDDGLPLEVCKKILQQTLLGVKELEDNNMMHTDLKPENILVCGLNREEELLLKTIQDINIKKVHKNQLDKIIRDNSNITETERWLASYKLYKEITSTIIKFMKNNMKDVKEQMKQCKISSKYIKDIKIKLCDFNLVLDLEENLDDDDVEIQTRYYRAPEIIIGYGLHRKTDYWSIGCIFFELLTGEILFDPEKDKTTSRDIYHMYLIEELMGQTPKKMIEFCKKSHKIFGKDGFLIGIDKKVKRWELSNVLKENHDNVALPDEILNKVIKFMSATLSINPDNRPTLKTMLKYLNNIDSP